MCARSSLGPSPPRHLQIAFAFLPFRYTRIPVKKPRPAKSIGRKRRAAGWTLLALGVIVAGVWVASGWWLVTGWCGDTRWFCRNGSMGCQIGVRRSSLPFSSPTFAMETYSERSRFTLRAESPLIRQGDDLDLFVFAVLSPTSHPGIRILAFALWPIPLLLCAPAAFLLRSGIIARRRAMTNTCPMCGYSLTGTAEGSPCPECGTGRTRSAGPS